MTAEDGFQVTVNEVAPTATVSGSGTINQGGTETFTITPADPDSSDTVAVYADWQGTGTFVPVNPQDLSPAGGGSFTFTHVYNNASPNGFNADIRVQDDGGQSSDSIVNVVVTPVSPTGGVKTGINETYPFRTVFGVNPDGSKDEVIAINDPIVFYVNTAAAFDGLTYYWTVDGAQSVTTQPQIYLPNYTVGSVHRIQAYFVDKFGDPSPTYALDAVVTGDGGLWATDYLGDPNSPPSGQNLNNMMMPTALLPSGTAVPPDFSKPLNYNEFGNATIPGVSITDNAAISFQVQVDTPLYGAPPSGYVPILEVKVYDVSQNTFGPPNHTLLTDTFYNAWSVPFPNGFPKDREIDVTALNQQQTLIVTTPLTPTLGQRILGALKLIKDLATRFIGQAGSVVSAVVQNASGFLSTLMGGLTGSVRTFFSDLTSGSGALFQGFLTWLAGSNTAAAFAGFTNSTDVSAFLLQFSGLTWAKVANTLRQALGAGNSIANTVINTLLANYIQSDPLSLVNFLTNLPNQLQALGTQYGVNLSSILSMLPNPSNLLSAVLGQLSTAMTQVPLKLAALFTPGAGVLTAIYNGASWVLNNLDQIGSVFQAFLDALPQLCNYNLSAFTNALTAALTSALPVVLSFAASQLGLAALPQGVRSALSYVPTQVNKALKALANKLASVLGGGNNAGAQTGSLAPAQTFVSPAGSTTQYTLYVTQTGGTLKVQVSGPNNSVTLLTAASFQGSKTAANDLDAYAAAATKYSTATSANSSALLTAYTNAANKLIADIQNNACQALGQGCFAMGTKLWTPQGYRNVEDIQPGDLVYARDENDPSAPVAARVVEERFVRTGNVLHLHVDGQLIRTTPEHPFYVFRKGWTQAGALVEGDWISTLAGGWVVVEELYDTGMFEAVYNLRVAEDHTYFVGDENWAFGVWAHNACLVMEQIQTSDTVGMAYAQAAWTYRQEHGWTSGEKNIAYAIANRLWGAYVSNRSGHAEEHLIDALKAFNIPNANSPVLSIFTEQSPCASGPGQHDCLMQLDALLKGQPGQVIIYYVIPYVTNQPGSVLMNQYAQLGFSA